MKRALLSAAALSFALAASAFAADLPDRKAPVYIPPPAPTLWTGFYVGVNAGGTFGGDGNTYVSSWPVYLDPFFASITGPLAWSATATAAGTGWVRTNNSGFIGGGQVGYNWQFGAGGLGSAWVVGIEADIQGVAGSSGASTFVSGLPAPPPVTPGFGIAGVTQVSNSLDYLGTVRGRIGFLFAPTLLVYGTGGLAYGGVNSSTSQLQAIVGGSLNPAWTNAWGFSGSYSDTRVGWTAGGGLEWMFAPHWSAKVEYLYYDLGSVSYNSGISGSLGLSAAANGPAIMLNSVSTSTRYNGQIVRAGVNYHFNWLAPAAVLAKY